MDIFCKSPSLQKKSNKLETNQNFSIAQCDILLLQFCWFVDLTYWRFVDCLYYQRIDCIRRYVIYDNPILMNMNINRAKQDHLWTWLVDMKRKKKKKSQVNHTNRLDRMQKIFSTFWHPLIALKYKKNSEKLSRADATAYFAISYQKIVQHPLNNLHQTKDDRCEIMTSFYYFLLPDSLMKFWS